MTRAKILPGMERSETPLEFPQSALLPFSFHAKPVECGHLAYERFKTDLKQGLYKVV